MLLVVIETAGALVVMITEVSVLVSDADVCWTQSLLHCMSTFTHTLMAGAFIQSANLLIRNRHSHTAGISGSNWGSVSCQGHSDMKI